MSLISGGIPRQGGEVAPGRPESQSGALDPPAMPYKLGVACVLLGALVWSTGGVGVKWLHAVSGNLGSLAISSARSGFAAILFLLLLRGAVGNPFRTSRWFLLGVVSYAFVVSSFVVATLWTSAANAILLQNTAPLWVLLLGGLLVGERATASDGVALALGGTGMVLCLWDGLAQSFPGVDAEGFQLSQKSLGDLVALASGMGFGLFAMVVRRIAKEGGVERERLRILFWGNALACAVGLPVLVMTVGGGALALGSVVVLLWLGFGQLGTGYLVFQKGLRVVPAMQASLLAFLEPVLNPIWVALAVGERPGLTTIAGGGLVLAAMVVSILARTRSAPEVAGA